jgi:hypothetical protein
MRYTLIATFLASSVTAYSQRIFDDSDRRREEDHRAEQERREVAEAERQRAFDERVRQQREAERQAAENGRKRQEARRNQQDSNDQFEEERAREERERQTALNARERALVARLDAIEVALRTRELTQAEKSYLRDLQKLMEPSPEARQPTKYLRPDVEANSRLKIEAALAWLSPHIPRIERLYNAKPASTQPATQPARVVRQRAEPGAQEAGKTMTQEQQETAVRDYIVSLRETQKDGIPLTEDEITQVKQGLATMDALKKTLAEKDSADPQKLAHATKMSWWLKYEVLFRGVLAAEQRRQSAAPK